MTTPPLASDLTLSSVFRIRDLDHIEALYAGEESGFIYARDAHPNAERLAKALAAMEGGEAGVVLSSGMGAISVLLLDLLSPGDRIVAGRKLYGKSTRLMAERFGRLGVETTFVNDQDLSAVREALKGRPRILWVESLSNPFLRAARIDELAKLARDSETLLAVDATFSPPPMLRPLDLGANVVMHSLTKILSGHGDVTLGCLVGPAQLMNSVANTASTFGFHAAAFDCWLTERGLATHSIRLERACANARQLAEFLSDHPKVAQVHYPGLHSHPDHAWMRQHAKMFGYMVTIEIHETNGSHRDAVNQIFQNFRRVAFCPSLGDVHTTVSHPASTSHRALSPAERKELGIHEGVIRISVGIEPAEETIADFKQALDSVP